MFFPRIIRTLQRSPVPAAILLFIGGFFVISNIPSSGLISLSSASKPEFVIQDSPIRRKSGEGDGYGVAPDTDAGELQRNQRPRWTYKCINNSCKRQEADANESIWSLEVCWLTCGSYGSVWPFPTSHKIGPNSIKFLPENIRLENVEAASDQVKMLIKEAFDIKRVYFENYPGLKLKSKSSSLSFWPFGSGSNRENEVSNVIKVSISSNSTEELLTLTTNESYEIRIDEDYTNSHGVHLFVCIHGSTFFGVRHGLETLSQLIALDASGEHLRILRNYYAQDGPKYPYRGILIDSARNFVPIDILKRIIDGMSYNKLNMLHLHLTDSNAFTFYSNKVPQLAIYGALSEKQMYYPTELKQLVRYALIRGVKIIPELDAPSHAGNGWQFGKKLDMGELAFYINAYDDSWQGLCGQPPCGILNPINTHVYDVLEKLYGDMLNVFDKDVFHMGGDEVNVGSWNEHPALRKWMEQHQTYGMGLWKFFQDEAFKRLKRHSENVTAILWTSSLTGEEAKTHFLDPSRYIIQIWESSKSQQYRLLLNRGFSMIVSFVDKFYLDWGEGTWLGNEHNWPYLNWQLFYDTKLNTGRTPDNQILGGEAPLWSEKTGKWQVEVKLWPRAVAFAENLWSNPKVRSADVYSRLNYMNYRMQERGIPTGQLQPESCLFLNGHCRNPRDVI